MNDSESIVYNWLVSIGYDERDIRINSSSTPDFITSDGYGWEVKKVVTVTRTGYVVSLRISQFKNLQNDANKTYIVVVKDNEVNCIVPFYEINIGDKSYGKVRMYWVRDDADMDKMKLTIYLDNEIDSAIRRAIPNKHGEISRFFEEAVTEKLEREGYIIKEVG